MDRSRLLFLSKLSNPKLKGHHPGLDDGPNFSEVVATPSPGFAVDYNDLGNSYDASKGQNSDRFVAKLRRHGALGHRF